MIFYSKPCSKFSLQLSCRSCNLVAVKLGESLTFDMRLAAYRSHLIKQLCFTSAMIGTASKFLNVTSRSVRHRCVRSMSTTATDNMLILENRNPHIMDDRITYCPTTKKFLFEGIELVHEIPFVVDDAFPKFDANEAIKKMMSSSTWPKQPYIKKDGTAYSVTSISLLHLLSTCNDRRLP